MKMFLMFHLKILSVCNYIHTTLKRLIGLCLYMYIYIFVCSNNNKINISYQFQEWGHWKGMDREKERGEIM